MTTSTALQEHPEQYILLAVRNEAATTYPHAGSTPRNYGSALPYAVSARALRLLNTIADDYHLQQVVGWPIQILAMECVIFKPQDQASRDQILAQLNRDSRVMLAQPLQSFSTQSSQEDNSQNGQSVVAYNDAYASLQTSLQRMEVGAAHRWSRGHNVRVAVVDTGIDTTHPDLQGRISVQRNFVNNDQTQFRLDRHGTAVAGVIAANANNGIGIVGVAPETQLLALKACWQLQPERDEARCNSFTLAQALASAIELRAQVINLSLIGPTDPLLSALITQANAAGIVVVGASADVNTRNGFPTNLPQVIGAIAMEQAAPSGTATRALPAPGLDVLTLVPGGRYGFSSGSSIATAEISGTVALLLAKQAQSKKAELIDLPSLLASSTHENSGDKLQSVSACLALSQLNRQIRCALPSATPTVNTASSVTTAR